MTDQEKMPMTKEEVQQFLADRKEAGKTIDVENCEFFWCRGYTVDPYGVHTLSPVEEVTGTNYFVRSPESRGWVHEYDLPPAIRAAFRKALPTLMKEEESSLRVDMLPDADRLVQKVMWRDVDAPGYALAVARGLAAHLGDGCPDMPDMLRRKPTTAPDACT